MGLSLVLLSVIPVTEAQVPPSTAAAPPATAASAPSVTPAPVPWKPFSDLAWLVGPWSGTASSRGRVGGRVVRFTMELSGNTLVERGSTIFPAEEGRPEESLEDVGVWTYDRERRKYVASYFFSTGVSGAFEAEIQGDGTIRLVAPSLLNYESGARARLTLKKAGDSGLDLSMDIAPPGRDFVAYLTSRLKKKVGSATLRVPCRGSGTSPSSPTSTTARRRSSTAS